MSSWNHVTVHLVFTDTRETQLNNPLEAQILVTTPEVLFDLYMNPALSKTWIPRIRYVIFDEIHCQCKLFIERYRILTC
jgi:superfamily II RNA helicase